MHIGLDLALRLNQSQLYNKLLAEEKDYLLNRQILNMILDDVNREIKPNDVITNSDIRNFYSIIGPLIISESRRDFINGDKYIDISLPKNTTAEIRSGQLISGRSYKLINPGTTDLANFGLQNNYVGSVFTFSPADRVYSTDDNVTWQLNLNIGWTYEILRLDEVSFTGYGASANQVGVQFTSNATATLTHNAMRETRLRVVAGLPAWQGNTALLPNKSFDVLQHLTSRSLIDTNCTIGQGALTKGNFYRVTAAGTIVGLTGFGSAYDKVEVGYVFLCTESGTPLWASSSVTVAEYRQAENRLVIYTDIDGMLNHSYGTVISSPLCVLMDNKLRVYHNNKFRIFEVRIDYIRPPIRIDSVSNIDCDLDELIHPDIVDKTANYAAATFAAGSYQHLKNEDK